jgi:hypothetical protein
LPVRRGLASGFKGAKRIKHTRRAAEYSCEDPVGDSNGSGGGGEAVVLVKEGIRVEASLRCARSEDGTMALPLLTLLPPLLPPLLLQTVVFPGAFETVVAGARESLLGGSRCSAGVAHRARASRPGYFLPVSSRLIVVLCSEIRFRNKKEAAIAACFLVFGFWLWDLKLLGAAEARVPFSQDRACDVGADFLSNLPIGLMYLELSGGDSSRWSLC